MLCDSITCEVLTCNVCHCSALSAIAGHYNNFGTDYPIPAKRKERILKVAS